MIFSRNRSAYISIGLDFVIFAAARKKGGDAPKGVWRCRIFVGGYERTLSHDKDLVPRVVIIKAAEPMVPTRGVRHESLKSWSAYPCVSRKREIRVILKEGRWDPPQESPAWSPADRRQGRLRSDREQRQYATRGDDVYKLFEGGSFVRPHVTTIDGPLARLITWARAAKAGPRFTVQWLRKCPTISIQLFTHTYYHRWLKVLIL